MRDRKTKKGEEIALHRGQREEEAEGGLRD
jgi:hypothetical protein